MYDYCVHIVTVNGSGGHVKKSVSVDTNASIEDPGTQG